jgi:hypothetical protein
MGKVTRVTQDMIEAHDAERVEKLAGLKGAPVRVVKQTTQTKQADLEPLDAKPQIVTLCGSMAKASGAMDQEAVRLTLLGLVVLIPNVDMRKSKDLFETTKECPSCHKKAGLIDICTLCGHSGRVLALDEEKMNLIKVRLDALHFSKIEMSDIVHFVNVDGYFGESTTNELKRAISLAKPLSFFLPDKIPQWAKLAMAEHEYEQSVTDYGDICWK